jgi:hypothetical protein
MMLFSVRPVSLLRCLYTTFAFVVSQCALLAANYRDSRLEILDFSVNSVPTDWQSTISTAPDGRLGSDVGQGINADRIRSKTVLAPYSLARRNALPGRGLLGGVGGTKK